MIVSYLHNPTSTNMIYTAKWNLKGAVVASQLALHLYVEHWMGRDSIQTQVPFKRALVEAVSPKVLTKSEQDASLSPS